MPSRYRSRTVIMSLQTLKEGQLYKKGKINKDWRQRLFVLNGKRLSYFKGGVSVCTCAAGCLNLATIAPSRTTVQQVQLN